MAEIPGVTFIFTDYDPGPSDPRIMFIPNSVDDATVSDLIDTFAARQADLNNLIFAPMMSAGGTEELGGGIEVAKTLTNLNLQIAFKPVRVWTSVGTITGADATGVLLTDTGANFVADAVLPGASVFNFRTGAIGTVFRVVNLENLLMLDALAGGTPDNEWQAGDTYRIKNIRQVNVSGGNDVAIDDLEAELGPILPTVFTQVVRTASASATTANIVALEHSTFGGGVTVDIAGGTAGTAFPAGTLLQPVNNMTDALAIAITNGLNKFFVRGDLTLNDASLNLREFMFFGQSAQSSLITVDTLADIEDCEFSVCTLTGVLDGGNTVRDAVVEDVSFFNGFLFQTKVLGTLTLGGSTAAVLDFCFGGAGATTIFDMGGSGSSLNLANFSGEVQIINKTGTDKLDVKMAAGSVELAASVVATAGDVVISGTAGLVNNATDPANVDATNLLSPATIAEATLESVLAAYVTNGTVGEALHRIYQMLALETGTPVATPDDAPNSITFDNVTISVVEAAGVTTLERT